METLLTLSEKDLCVIEISIALDKITRNSNVEVFVVNDNEINDGDFFFVPRSCHVDYGISPLSLDHRA